MGGCASAVSEGDWEKVKRVGSADLLVGIPSFNNASTIGHVVGSAAEGMVRHFSGLKGVIVDADGGSLDGTRETVEATPVPDGVGKLASPIVVCPGRGALSEPSSR